MTTPDDIVRTVLTVFPNTQAIYLFGSYGTGNEWPTSDVDIALLLPLAEAKQAGSLMMSELRFALESLLKKEVDLINLRQVSTVLQKEIIFAERRIYCADTYAADEFAMLVLSFYQKLNQERQGILDEFQKTRRAYPV
ncbi:nucleotidyltransferase domain-containing protein [Candidatus Poribacteria bacterium]|nr:nucleotidyltransferase domain-containing protein [Candidatus Poribacteria bacterium]